MIPFSSLPRSLNFTSLFRILAALVLTHPVSAALFRTNLDQAGPPPNCFEAPTIRLTVTNPADSGQIWDVTITVNRFITVSTMSEGGYYTGPQATGEVVRLQPGDGLHLWQARGTQVVNGNPIVGINWIENHTIAVSMVGPTQYDVTTTVSPVGAGTVSGGGGYDEGDTATLQASPNSGYFFVNWGGDLSGSTNPQDLLVDGAKSVSAQFVANSPPAVFLTSPSSQTITVGTTLQLSSTATDANGNLTWHNLDIQRPAGDWNFQGGFATGEPYQGGPIGDGSNSNRSANFSFNEVGSYTIRAGANDGGDWVHSNSVTITVNPAVTPNRDPTIAWTAQPSSADHLQSYTVAARAQDADGNLARVRIWKNGGVFATGDTGDGSTRDGSNTSTDAGPATVSFTAQAEDEDGAVSPVISHTVTIGSPPNEPPTVTLISPASQSIEVGTALEIRSRATDPNGNLTNHNLDIQRPAGDWNFAGGFATGEPFQGGPVNDAADSTRTATFRFDEVGTYLVRAAANDGSGWIHSATVTLTVTAAIIPNRDPTIAWTAQPSRADHLQSYTVAASAQDADGNLSEVRLWKNGTLVDSSVGGTGSLDEVTASTNDSGPTTVTFTAQAEDSEGATSSVISYTITIDAPANAAPTIAWTSAPSGAESDQLYTIAARGSDADGNLTEVKIWKDGADFATETAGIGNAITASADSSDSGPQSLIFTAQATDQMGATSAMITHSFTVAPPMPVYYSLTTQSESGGTVSLGGFYLSGSPAIATATADAAHDFIGWNGDASGSANPLSLMMDRDKVVIARFGLKNYLLSTDATLGGSVTPGGIYPHGSTVTVSAVAEPDFRFVNWIGDITSAATSIAITMNGPRFVRAEFVDKSNQSISFANLPDVNPGVGTVLLIASATSGLPVSFSVSSGPAVVTGSSLQILGPGPIFVQADQPGNNFFLPAPSVTRSFSVVTPAKVKYRADGRTLLQREKDATSVPFIIEQP